MLASVPIPGVVGLEPSATNVASARNSGVELYLNYRNNDREDFSYSVGGNISFIKNEVTDLGAGGTAYINRKCIWLRGFRFIY